MINIKTFATPKEYGNSSTDVSSTSSGSTTVIESNADKWFFFDTDSNSVGCRYNLYSVGNVSAFGAEPSEGGGGTAVNVYDGLDSTSTTEALSANQGRVLKWMIDNINSGSGSGQVMNSCDWTNVTNKPSTFAPSAHTHSMNDINGLNSQLSFYSQSIAAAGQNFENHTTDTSIHLSAAQAQFLNQLMNIFNISGGTLSVNGNIVASGNITANAT